MTDDELAERLVTSAGELALRMHAEGLDVERKSSFSDVVTAADHAAEALIAETLRRERPGDGLLGEEGSALDSRTGRRWVADPIDGTYNFQARLPNWCSAIALEDADGLVLGAVHQPATGETWVGGRGIATRRNGATLAPLADLPLAECGLATFLHPGELADPFDFAALHALMAAAATPRVLGSGSCDLAAVAGGRLGLWVQSDTAPWDWLPGRALVEAAGGVTRIVARGERRWHLAGGRRAVDEAEAVLRRA